LTQCLGGRLGLAAPEDQVDVDRVCLAVATVTGDRDGGNAGALDQRADGGCRFACRSAARPPTGRHLAIVGLRGPLTVVLWYAGHFLHDQAHEAGDKLGPVLVPSNW
jgi:hypothetical protein